MIIERKEINLKKEHKEYYSAFQGKITLVEVKELNYLSVDGQGDPNHSREFEEAMEALYSTAYALKFFMKQREIRPIDFKVMPLQGLWWADDPSVFMEARKEKWQWTMQIPLPEEVDSSLLEEILAIMARKGKSEAGHRRLKLGKLTEGFCAQTLHLGPYSEEGPTIQGLHQFIAREGYEFNGPHHEIYLGDPGGQPRKN